MKIFKIILLKTIIISKLFCATFPNNEDRTVCTHILYDNLFIFTRSNAGVIVEINSESTLGKRVQNWLQVTENKNSAYLLPYTGFRANIPWSNLLNEQEIQKIEYANFLKTLKGSGYKILAKTIYKNTSPQDEFVLRSAEVSANTESYVSFLNP